MPDDEQFYSIWLDQIILEVVEDYFGFTPVLCEAFIRRNYPSEHVVMNHGWHRDKNHKTHLLKAFIFLNDCNLDNGPHHFVSESHLSKGLDSKPYYSDEEVSDYIKKNNFEELVSVVPKGTIILEDTRGLHKAGIPKKGYRDLGFCTFMPDRAVMKRKSDYTISQFTKSNLTKFQNNFLINR